MAQRDLRLTAMSAGGDVPRIRAETCPCRPSTALTLRTCNDVLLLGGVPVEIRQSFFRGNRACRDNPIGRRVDCGIWTRQQVLKCLTKSISVLRACKDLSKRTYVQPDVMSLLRWSGELHLPLRRGDNDAVLVDTRWHRVRIQNSSYVLNVGYKTC